MLAATSSNFLIPNWTFVAELIIFLIVTAVMAKIVLPPLTKAADGRAATIRGEIQAAEAARADAEQASRDRRSVLAEARAEARGLVDEANREAEQVRAESRASAQEEYSRRLDSARASIDIERERARHDLTSDLGALVVAAAEHVIRTDVDPQRHQAVIAAAVAHAESLGSSGSRAHDDGAGS